MTPPVAGDILFFASSGKLIDRMIERRTGSDVVHVAIVVDANTVIQAVSGGVELHALPTNYAYIARVGAALAQADPSRFHKALADLLATVGTPYGFGDIFDQALMLLPGRPAISFDRSYDCSHLAAVWLEAAGYALPFDTEADRITPGDLKRILHPEKVVSVNIFAQANAGANLTPGQRAFLKAFKGFVITGIVSALVALFQVVATGSVNVARDWPFVAGAGIVAFLLAAEKYATAQGDAPLATVLTQAAANVPGWLGVNDVKTPGDPPASAAPFAIDIPASPQVATSDAPSPQ